MNVRVRLACPGRTQSGFTCGSTIVQVTRYGACNCMCGALRGSIEQHELPGGDYAAVWDFCTEHPRR